MQTSALNGYFINLHQKYLSENHEAKVSFSLFARMWPSQFEIANWNGKIKRMRKRGKCK